MESIRYPLSPAQKIMFVSMKYSIKKQVVNVPTTLLIKEELDYDLLKRALDVEHTRNDALRIRFEKENGEAYQYFIDNVKPPEYELLDFTGKTSEEQDKALSMLAGKPFKIYRENPYVIYLVKGCDGYNGLFFNVNHLIMDSSAAMVFYKDVFDIYYALKNNGELPKPLASYEELLKKELDYVGSFREKEDIEFFRNLFANSDEAFYCGVNVEILERTRKKYPGSRAANGFSLFKTKVSQKVFHMDQEKMDEIFSFCKQYRVPFQCVFTMGIRTYLSLINNREKDVSINATVARRGTLSEKRTGGTRIHFFPARSIVEDSDSFLDAVQQIAGYQNMCFRHVDLDPQKMWEIQKIQYIGKNNPSVGYESMSLTYQPLKMDLPGNADLKSKWISPGYASNPLYITVMHNISHQGGLDIYYEFQTAVMSAEDAERFQSVVLKTIELGIKNPQITVGEIFNKL